MTMVDSSRWSSMLSTWLESAAGPPSESEIEGLVTEILDHGWAAPEAAYRVGLRVLRRDQAFGRALAAATRHDVAAVDGAVGVPAFAAALARPLARAILRSCLVTSPEVELVLTRWRRRLLLDRPAEAPLDAIVSLALQCWLNEFVFAETKDETSALGQLSLSGDAAALAVLACYRPLNAPAHTPAAAPDLTPLLDAHIREPAQEAALQAGLPQVLPVTDPTSRAVRDQYEANPYPRWVTCQRDQPRRFTEFLSAMAQAYGVTVAAATAAPEILIAGCGTGMQAIQCAGQFDSARVTGLDLSRPSLAYAARKAHDARLKNLEFVTGDLLALAHRSEWHDRFHYVECLGVLHHLAHPGQGLSALAACIKPGGLAYLGLYSATARRAVTAGRDVIAREKFPPNPAGIRAFRKHVTDALRQPGPKAERLLPLTQFIDFYSMSMCRDLVFNVQEHQFTPAGVVALVAAAGLQFLGFGITDGALAGSYVHANPRDTMIRDPAGVAAFERKNPTAFASMYLCLVRKPIE